MPRMGFKFALIVGVAVVVAAAPNLLQNPDFESLSNWDCSGHHCELTTDKHSGQHAIKSTGRTQTWMGPSQWVTLKQNTRYEAAAFVKLLQNAQGKMFAKVLLTIEFDLTMDQKIMFQLLSSPPCGKTTGSNYQGTSSHQTEVIQTTNSFPFGTAVAADELLTGDGRYRDFIYQKFNWAVLENALKWQQMEGDRYRIDYDKPLQAIRELKRHGIKVRAHCVVWSVDEFNPNWLKSLYQDGLRQAVTERINGVVPKVKGLVEAWDVNNENLHGWFFQQHSGDFDYIIDIYRQVHNADNTVPLFTNDYDVVARGTLTTAYRDHIIKIKNANVGLRGIGVQAISVPRRLDKLSETGLPIFITELDVTLTDENYRADCYEKALRAFYGHPNVKGILLWGFWSNRHWRGSDASLVTGNEFKINAAGQKYLNLIEQEWRTYMTHTLSRGGNFDVYGFKGDYQVKVQYNNRVVKDEHVTLGDSPQTVHLHISS